MVSEMLGQMLVEQKVGRGFDVDKLFTAMAEENERCDNCGFYLCRCVDDSIKPEERDENDRHV